MYSLYCKQFRPQFIVNVVNSQIVNIDNAYVCLSSLITAHKNIQVHSFVLG